MFALPLLFLLFTALSPALPVLPVLPVAYELPAAAPHKFHVTYSRIAIEGNTVAARVRFFKDDLSVALASAQKLESYRVEPSARQDSIFLAYFNSNFVLNDGQTVLSGTVMGSGEEMEGQEPMWWYLIQYEAESTIQTLHITNKLLKESFEDQKNIVQIQHFPSEKTWSLYFVDDDLDYLLEFDT